VTGARGRSMQAVGRISRTCWNDQRLKGGLSQLASVTCRSVKDGNPCINGLSIRGPLNWPMAVAGRSAGSIPVKEFVDAAPDAVDRAGGGIVQKNRIATLFGAKPRRQMDHVVVADRGIEGAGALRIVAQANVAIGGADAKAARFPGFEREAAEFLGLGRPGRKQAGRRGDEDETE